MVIHIHRWYRPHQVLDSGGWMQVSLAALPIDGMAFAQAPRIKQIGKNIA
ncbi:hypothetical protein KC19_7G174400 [Ceratodon purpureus]|uniref:Uncharacterized protein n=1 Tax=Ceratodon purpureus TaxID=3225 RepID=A0A8T0H7P7_CERPU|nr:hypothetical protein KC19_7G174400 [Ceratodon purpureus]